MKKRTLVGEIKESHTRSLSRKAGEGWGEGMARKVVLHRKSTFKARTLRKTPTEAEEKFWHAVKGKKVLGLKFKRQHPIDRYCVDFVCLEKNLVVEIDGGQHCESVTDKVRTDFLNKEGFEVIRFWNNDVLQNIERAVSSLSLALSRKRERGSHTEKEIT